MMRPNWPFQRTRATKWLGVFRFRGVARGAERGRWARSRMSKSASGGQVRRETSGRSCCARFGMVAVWPFAELGRVGRADGSIVCPTTPQDNLKSHA